MPTLAADMTRFTGPITERKTGTPIPDVCVVIGPPLDCLDTMPHSDRDGIWFADLPVAGGLSWTFNFVKDGYLTEIIKSASDAPGEKQIVVVLTPK